MSLSHIRWVAWCGTDKNQYLGTIFGTISLPSYLVLIRCDLSLDKYLKIQTFCFGINNVKIFTVNNIIFKTAVSDVSKKWDGTPGKWLYMFHNIATESTNTSQRLTLDYKILKTISKVASWHHLLCYNTLTECQIRTSDKPYP